MPTPPLPIITPTSLTYRSIDGRVLPLTNLELDGNMSYLEKLAEERLPISDFTGQNIVNLINDTTGIGINAMYISGYTASIEPVPLTVPIRDGNGIIYASAVTADTFYGKSTSSGDADTAGRLKTAVAINGVDFDGSTAISIYDDTKLSLDGGVLSGKLVTVDSNTTEASIRITPGYEPESPVNGDVWITSLGQFNRINGATKQVAYTDSDITGTADNVSGVVAIANGGTGKKTSDDARAALGAAASGANSDITRLSGLTVAITATQGGTGLTSAGDAGNVLTSDGTSWVSAPFPSNVVSATKLQTPQAINGVNFDGSAPITIYDDTKLPLVGGVLTGKLTIAESTAASSGLLITPGSAPESPANGDVWITSLGQFNRINGATKQVAYTNSDITGTAGNVSGVVAIANGGTGKKTADDARAALGAAKSGINSDITRLSGLTVAITATQGGTGLTSAGDAGNVLMSDGTSWVSAPPLLQTTSSAPLVGAVVYFAMGAIDPGWLPCDGFAYSRTTYKKLFDKIRTTYGAGDGSSTFNVPNLFGEFIRGVSANRTIGSWQGDEIRSHSHKVAVGPSEGDNTWTVTNGWSNGTFLDTNATGGDETRPRNVALLPCIFSGVTSSSVSFEAFTIMPGRDSVNEGSSISFNVTGISSTNRSTLYWETESIVGSTGDFVNWSGTVNLTNSSGAFAITTISNTGTTDRSFRVKIYGDSSKSKLFSQTGTITIVDTTITISNFRLIYGTWSTRIFIELTGEFPIGTVFYGTENNGNGRFTVTANSNNDIGWDSSIYSYRTVTITQTFSSVMSGGVDLRTGGYTGDIVSSVNVIDTTDDMPRNDQTCFPKNSNVLLYNGSWKPIQDITTNDILMGANGKSVNVQKMDTPLLGNRKMYQFFDGHTWSEEHAHWVFDNETQREWWWSANPQMWREEVKSGAIHGLKDNQSIICHNNVKFAYLTGFVTRQIEQVDYPSDTQLYLPITDGTPIIVNGYIVGAGVNEFAFDYTQFQWIPTCIKE